MKEKQKNSKGITVSYVDPGEEPGVSNNTEKNRNHSNNITLLEHIHDLDDYNTRIIWKR
jgi:hypothetical protein